MGKRRGLTEGEREGRFHHTELVSNQLPLFTTLPLFVVMLYILCRYVTNMLWLKVCVHTPRVVHYHHTSTLQTFSICTVYTMCSILSCSRQLTVVPYVCIHRVVHVSYHSSYPLCVQYFRSELICVFMGSKNPTPQKPGKRYNDSALTFDATIVALTKRIIITQCESE